MSRIMIVDDEEGILNSLRRLMLRAPCRYGCLVYELEIETFVSPDEALDRAKVVPFDMVLSDYHMPSLNGVDFLAQIERIQPDAARMILTGYDDIELINNSILGANIFGMLPKPWNDSLLMSVIAQALNHRDLLIENRALAGKVSGKSGN
jgi:DNA-binding NtrC family response regulator